MSYVAFVLSEQSRKDLLAIFPPKYSREVCHHITLHFGEVSDEVMESLLNYHGDQGFIHPFTSFIVSGHYDDESGVECLEVINVTDNGHSRPSENKNRMDGRMLHITHSLGEDRRPVESNNIVGQYRYLVRNLRIQITGSIQILD